MRWVRAFKKQLAAVRLIRYACQLKCRILRLFCLAKVMSMRGLTIRIHFTFALAAAISLHLTIAACCQNTANPKVQNQAAQCRLIKNELMRTRCYEEMNSKLAPPQDQPPASGRWQLTRTANPSGGPDSISITKNVNSTPAQDVSGLMLRCAEGATTEVLVVLAAPLPSRTHPKVTVLAGATTTDFIATVLAPGGLVLLPEKASALLEHSWQSVPELTVTIAGSQRSLHGVIPLDDIGSAMQTLQSNCPTAVHGRN
jgi:hypothetical protein